MTKSNELREKVGINPSYNKDLPMKVRLNDFLGKYYINLNGVKPNNIPEITEPHKKEIVDFMEALYKQEIERFVDDLKEEIKTNKSGILLCGGDDEFIVESSLMELLDKYLYRVKNK